MDLELSARELLLDPHPLDQRWHEMRIDDEEVSYRVHFRLPTGADQEAVAARGARDAETAAQQIARRCVDRVVDAEGTELPEEAWPGSLVEELSEQLETLDPQAELIINSKCPFCNHGFSRLFDVAAYFSKELGGREERFYREVHTLAFYYHWSEQEIMRLTLPQRHRYIELINETLSEDRR
jgi:hypothetical protein